MGAFRREYQNNKHSCDIIIRFSYGFYSMIIRILITFGSDREITNLFFTLQIMCSNVFAYKYVQIEELCNFFLVSELCFGSICLPLIDSILTSWDVSQVRLIY